MRIRLTTLTGFLAVSSRGFYVNPDSWPQLQVKGRRLSTRVTRVYGRRRRRKRIDHSDMVPPPNVPVRINTNYSVEITGLTSMGEGVARVDDFVLLVPFTAPGDRVTVRVWRILKQHAKADVVELEVKSKDRVSPMCSLFGDCGGCQLQHVSLERQRDWKRQHVEDALKRLAGYSCHQAVNPVIGGTNAYGYRSKLTPHYDTPDAEAEIGPIGFRTQRMRIVDVPHCPIATEAINQALPEVRRKARLEAKAAVEAYRTNPNNSKKPRGATLLLRDHDHGVSTQNKELVSESVTLLSNNFTKLKFTFQAGDFWQNNPQVLPMLVEYVVAEARASSARFLVDCYCGGGLFALSAAWAFDQVAGLEISATNVQSARKNADANNITNAKFEAGRAEDLFAAISSSLQGHDSAVVIDPPRAGCSSDFLTQLLDFGPKSIVYVSCDPATQARDAAIILADPRYSISNITPFDLFPQTRHIENVITFTSSSSSSSSL